MKLIPNSFQMPNAFVDEVMVKLNDPAVKIYLVIVRKTRGWHKEFDSISLHPFFKHDLFLSGLFVLYTQQSG